MPAPKLSKSQLPPFQLSLRIRHPSMDPVLITRELKVTPEHTFRVGEPRQSRSGLRSVAKHAESYWLAVLDPAAWLGDMSFLAPAILAESPQPLNEAVTKNLGWALSLCAMRFGKIHDKWLRQIRSDGGQVSLLVALAPDMVSSFTVAPEISHMFGELGITLEFEIAND
jgi:hypothetical protein